jgi:hypothetical protein
VGDELVARRDLEVLDQLVRSQGRVELGVLTGQPVELGHGDDPAARSAAHVHGGVERRQRDAHVGRVGRDAVLAGAEDCVLAGQPADGRATRPRRPLVARHGDVVEVHAPGALQQVAAVARHVADLR